MCSTRSWWAVRMFFLDKNIWKEWTTQPRQEATPCHVLASSYLDSWFSGSGLVLTECCGPKHDPNRTGVYANPPPPLPPTPSQSQYVTLIPPDPRVEECPACGMELPCGACASSCGLSRAHSQSRQQYSTVRRRRSLAATLWPSL